MGSDFWVKTALERLLNDSGALQIQPAEATPLLLIEMAMWV
jgi:hypothetical protein